MNDFTVKRFDWIDYSIFIGTLILSAAVGLYFARGGHKTVNEYLFGGRKLSYLPVCISLVTSHMSSSSYLGIPTEIYLYGWGYMFVIFSVSLASIIIAFLIVPILFDLDIISLFEYMELRFSRPIRLITSFIHTVQWILHITIILYGASLTFNQVTGMSMEVIAPLMCFVCMLYTAVGGLKAVVWTDTFQAFVMVISTVILITSGVIQGGGIAKIYQAILEGDRFELPSISIDPTIRLSVWTLLFGYTTLALNTYGLVPSSFQRFVSVPTLKESQKSVFLFCTGICFLTLTLGIIGLFIYAANKDCDPLTAKLIKKVDQLVPFYVMQLSEHTFKGISGLFLSGILSAALSTISTGFNTISGTIYKDFLEPLFPTKPSEKKARLLMITTIIIIGCLCILSMYVVEKFGSLIEASVGIIGSATGLIGGLFLLAMFNPFANSKGAVFGSLIGAIAMLWLHFNRIKSKGLIKPEWKELSTELCINATLAITHNQSPAEAKDVLVSTIFNISVYYYAFISTMIVIILGSVISLLTGRNAKTKLDPKLISPLLRKYIELRDEYNNVPLENTDIKL